MEPLSVVANIAQVISLADTIWRIGKETHRIIAAVKNVPHEIRNLALEVQEVDALLVNISRYCDRYQAQHPSISSAHRSPIDQVYATLQNLQAEYYEVSKLVADNLETDLSSKRRSLRRLGGKFKLVLGGKIGTSVKNLNKYKSQLSIHLQVLAGYNDLAVNDRLESLHRAVLNIDISAESKIVRAIEEKPIDSLEQHVPDIRENHARQAIDSLVNQLSTMNCTFEKSTDRYLDCWTGDAQHIQRAALPLSLLKPKIQEALSLMMVPQPSQSSLSAKDVQWIRSELENLLATSYEKAAVAIRNSPETSASTLTSDHGNDKGRTSALSPFSVSKSQLKQTQSVVATQFVLQDAPAGKISIQAQWSKDKSGCVYASDIVLMLAPKPELAEDGIFISLSRSCDALQRSGISRQIASYAVVESTSPVFACVRSNDIDGLRRLLESRDATPTVRNTENESLLSYAARLLRLEICELLLNEGADPNHCRGDGANAIYDVRNAFWYRSSSYSVPKPTLNKMLRLFVSAGCDINSIALGGSPLHFTVGHSSPGNEMIDESEIASLVDLLICLGCDIEHQNSDGLTPLLYNAVVPRWHGVAILRALLQWGANPHAVTNFGEGALHLAIAFSGPGSFHSEHESTSLEARLALLLRAGCDPNLLDMHGHSPSDFALGSPRTWFQWCMAVEGAGRSTVESVLDNENDFCRFETDPGREECDSRGESACLGRSHVFLGWNGFFPWSVRPLCSDCGRLCDLQDIPRRKLAALRIYQELRAQFTT